MQYWTLRQAFLGIFFAQISFFGLAPEAWSNSPTAVEYVYTNGLAPKRTLPVLPRSPSLNPYIGLKQLCFTAGCKIMNQWSHSRTVVQNEKEKRSALLSYRARTAIIDGKILRSPDAILLDPKEGLLIPIDLAIQLVRGLQMGRIWSEKKEIESAPVERTELRQIVLDPGHGGNDHGTSSEGIFEKDVALIYAEELREKLLEAMPSVKVDLTRKGDNFVSLPDRAKLANAKSADLFISLHLNHAVNPKVEGLETYILSPDATDDEARKLALLENESWLKGSELNKGSRSKNDPIQKILVDMEQTKFIQSSALAASLVQQEILTLGKTRGVRSRGVKQALFFVLSQVAMPSILVEMGFLSSSGDRGRLMDVKFRDEFVQKFTTALVRYKSKLENSSKTR